MVYSILGGIRGLKTGEGDTFYITEKTQFFYAIGVSNVRDIINHVQCFLHTGNSPDVSCRITTLHLHPHLQCPHHFHLSTHVSYSACLQLQP